MRQCPLKQMSQTTTDASINKKKKNVFYQIKKKFRSRFKQVDPIYVSQNNIHNFRPLESQSMNVFTV